MEKIKILYIDDEIVNLQAFKASFRRQFDIHLAKSAEEGLDVLKNHPIEVVIADQRMPDKTGVDFFESIIDIHPNPIRILLTAYSDINAIIDAINRGQVYRYVTKPWNEYDLKLTIENAYQLYLLREQNNKLNLKYKEVFNSSTDPIILFDTKGRIVDYNKATLNLIEDNQEALYFTSFNSILYNKSDAMNMANLLKQNKHLKDYECKVLTKNGKIKTCLISGNSITNNYNEIISHQVLIKDITHHSEASQKLLKNTIQTQEKERERIAKDLHDGLGQSLVSIKLKLELLKSSLNEDQANEINKLSKDISSSVEQLRNICHDMIPSTLKEFGLKNTLNQICHTLENDKLSVNLITSDNIDKVDKEIQVAIYRITQEFISNSIKHSNCSEININIEYDRNIKLNLNDNGKGFDIKKNYNGFGIQNIISRVKSFNGAIKFKSKPKKGTAIEIFIPQTNQNATNEYVKNINTETFNIGLTEQGVVIAKPLSSFVKSPILSHAQENIKAIKEITKNKKHPLITYLPEYYINNESFDFYNQFDGVSASAYVYQSVTQQKFALQLLNTKNKIPHNIFNNEDDALEWAKQYIK